MYIPRRKRVIRINGLRISISEYRFKEDVTMVVSNTTMGYPTAKADVRNNKGKTGVYHKG